MTVKVWNLTTQQWELEDSKNKFCICGKINCFTEKQCFEEDEKYWNDIVNSCDEHCLNNDWID